MHQLITDMMAELDKVVSGYQAQKLLTLQVLFGDGHILFVDVPGTGKTTLAKAIAACIGGVQVRIQATPELEAHDMTGVQIYDQKDRQFLDMLGPIVKAHVVLVDELNRMVSKTQSGLLEAMQERTVTIAGPTGATTYQLPRPFMVIATMNPIDSEGTFVIPWPNWDRFAAVASLGYVTPEQEVAMLRNVAVHGRNSTAMIQKVVSPSDVVTIQDQVVALSATASDSMLHYIVDAVGSTRPGVKNGDEIERAAYERFNSIHLKEADELRAQFDLGASPRAGISALRLSAAHALLIRNDDAIRPEDFLAILQYVISHRVMLSPKAEANGVRARDLVLRCVSHVKQFDRTGRKV